MVGEEGGMLMNAKTHIPVTSVMSQSNTGSPSMGSELTVYIDSEPYPKVDQGSDPNTVRMLKEDYAGAVSEMTAVAQYIYQNILCTDNESFANAILQIAIVEMNHLDMIGDAILALGGNPTFGNGSVFWQGKLVNYARTIPEMLRADIEAETQAIANYERHAASTKNASVRALLERIVRDEQLHLRFFRETLSGLVDAQPALPAVPSELDALESGAEDIIDYIDNMDWTKAESTVQAMKQDLVDLEPSFRAANVPTSIVNEIRTRLTMLEAQVKARNAYEAKVQANAITKVIPDIYDHYQVTVPTDLGRLDYLGREILLNVEKGDWTAARNTAAEVLRVWTRLKPNLNAAAQKSAADFESTVNALVGDVGRQDSVATTRDASALLDKVDVLEQAYTG
jgi:bacterioferritin